MKILRKENNISFGSLNNPIKHFRIHTPKGRLNVNEYRLKPKSVNFSFDVSKFFNDNFLENSTDPLWKEYLKPENKLRYLGKNQRYAKYLRDVFKNDDGNTTLLIARDSQNKIKAAVLSLGFDEPVSLVDPKLCNLEAIAVDKDFRGFHIGKRLLEKTLQSAQNAFTDVVLTAYEKAIPFYEKMGFKILPQNTVKTDFFYKEIQKERDDIPKYVQIMSKPLRSDEQRFYDRVQPTASFRLKSLIRDYNSRIKKVFNRKSD